MIEDPMAKRSIRIDIAGRTYPLNVEAAQADRIETAAEEISKRMEDLKGRYAVRDKHDLLAMTLLEWATEEKASAPVSEPSTDDVLQEILQSMDALEIR